MIVYFTGTGNSRYCAQMLADKLDDEIVDAFHFIRNGIPAELISGRPWIFVAPTYGWQLPRIFVDFIRSGSFLGSKDAYFVMTCAVKSATPSQKTRRSAKKSGSVSWGLWRWSCRKITSSCSTLPGRTKPAKL